MKGKIVISVICAVISLFYSYAYSQTAEKDISKEKIKVRIKWQEVENAVSYRILIRNSEGVVITDSNTESNSIDLDIPRGEYSMRIGAVNKFHKVGSWSDWASITVKESEQVPKIAEKKPEITERPYTPFKIGAGISYFYILPETDGILENSYSSGNLVLGYALGKLIPFRFFRFTGFEAEAIFAKFEGKTAGNGITINKTDILAGGNIYFTTAFNYPVNLILRAGGGVAFAKLEYKNIDAAGTDLKLESQDPYYKFGSAIEITPLSHFFIETGAEYCSIMYIGEKFNTLRFFMRAGFRF
jgi:hypothetical protein